MIKLIIEKGGRLYKPHIVGEVTLHSEKVGVATKVTFDVLPDKDLDFTEGSIVRVYFEDKKLFYGFVFSKSRNKKNIINVVAYDQLRYLKNRDTMNYINLTASEVIKKVASNFSLKVGDIADSKYRISRIERNSPLLNIIETALKSTKDNTNKDYVFYDDFGKLTLKDVKDLKTKIIINESSAEDFTYSTSIDIDTYNKIVLLPYESNKEDDPYCPSIEDSKNIDSWGVLQLVTSVEKEENQNEKLKALKKEYNKKTVNLSIKNNLGDVEVRAGVMVYVKLNLHEMYFEDYLVVDKCTHKFFDSQHFMDLTLIGGGIFV